MLDPDKPLVASSAFAAGDGVVSAGEVFDWRARGMTLVEVAPLYASGLLVHSLDPQPAPSSPPPSAAARASSSDDTRHHKRRR